MQVCQRNREAQDEPLMPSTTASQEKWGTAVTAEHRPFFQEGRRRLVHSTGEAQPAPDNRGRVDRMLRTRGPDCSPIKRRNELREVTFQEQEHVAGGVRAGPNGEGCTEPHNAEKKK